MIQCIKPRERTVHKKLKEVKQEDGNKQKKISKIKKKNQTTKNSYIIYEKAKILQESSERW